MGKIKKEAEKLLEKQKEETSIRVMKMLLERKSAMLKEIQKINTVIAHIDDEIEEVEHGKEYREGEEIWVLSESYKFITNYDPILEPIKFKG